MYKRQVPIGAEEAFKGLVDLIKMKVIYWHDETMGADYSIAEIPAELIDEANEWRDKMLEKVAEFDDDSYSDQPMYCNETAQESDGSHERGGGSFTVL